MNSEEKNLLTKEELASLSMRDLENAIEGGQISRELSGQAVDRYFELSAQDFGSRNDGMHQVAATETRARIGNNTERIQFVADIAAFILRSAQTFEDSGLTEAAEMTGKRAEGWRNLLEGLI